MTKIKLSSKFLTANGKRIGIFYGVGPWVEGVRQDTVKIYCRKWRGFPPEVRAVFAIENNSDGQTDYFEADAIRLLPGHPYYAAAKAAAVGSHA